MSGFFVRVNKKYYRQTLLEECKYETKNNKMENLINEDLDPSSSDESDNEFDNESEKPSKKPFKKSNNDKSESD